MKRIISMILCLLMLVTSVPLLASCGGQKTVDLASASVVRSESISTFANKYLTECLRKVGNVTGSIPKASSEGGDDKVELLIGNTSRPETAKAMKDLEDGAGYVIRVIKNKVVIAGTSNLLTCVALQEFVKMVEAEGAVVDGKLSMPAKTVKTDCATLEIANADGVQYKVVYSSLIDDDTSTNGIEGNATQAVNDSLSYQYTCISAMRRTIAESIGLKIGSVKTDWDKREAKDQELVIGHTLREESKQVLEGLNEMQYIVKVVNSRIVANGFSDTTIGAAATTLGEILADCVETTDTGAKIIRYPVDFVYVGEQKSDWVTDFTKPEGLVQTSTCDVADGHLEYYYTGEGVNADAFGAYCTKLEAEGYKKYHSATVEDSSFVTYTNESKNIMLYVSFMAYKHNTKYSTSYPQAIRVISAKLNKVALPVLTPDLSYTKLTDTMITQMYLHNENDIFGNAYIITLEDGSFIVYDGGGTGSRTVNGETVYTDETTRIYNLMLDLRALVTKDTASGMDNKITIAAWVMSHAHWDHEANFREFCKKFGKYNNITFEKAIANYPSPTEVFNAYNPGSTTATLDTMRGQVNGPFTYHKMHTGQRIWVRNVEIEVLYTHEDMHPDPILYFNDSSSVFRFHYHVTDGNGNITDPNGVATTGVWLGDLYKYGSRLITSTYGSYIKSDMVQVAHHGYNGCEKALYAAVSPSVVWWPTDGQAFENQAINSSGSYWPNVVNRFIYHELASVKYIFVAGHPIKNMRKNYTIRITADGIDAAHVYYAGDSTTEDKTQSDDVLWSGVPHVTK